MSAKSAPALAADSIDEKMNAENRLRKSKSLRKDVQPVPLQLKQASLSAFSIKPIINPTEYNVPGVGREGEGEGGESTGKQSSSLSPSSSLSHLSLCEHPQMMLTADSAMAMGYGPPPVPPAGHY